VSALALAQSLTAIGVNLTSSFAASGGTAPYTYSVRPNGAGGTINSSTGLYTAPNVVPSNPAQLFDTIQVTDSVSATANAKILIGDPLLLFCDIIQNQLGLTSDRVYIWDQKIMQPTSSGLYVAVSVLSCKVFGNTNSHVSVSGGINSGQSVNVLAQLQVDIISRDSSARTRKEEVVMALASDYAETQQEANSFFIGKLPPGASFTNLSVPDGAAIPYRFAIGVALQYFATKTQAVNYMNTFAPVSINYSQS
jgi:hypothetical protein